MNFSKRLIESPYMHWAKTLQAARFNLGNSGVSPYPLRELPVRLEDLELSGPSFYGWPPLQSALAHHLGMPEDQVVHACGTSMANHLAMAVTVDPGDDVLIERPTYELLISTAEYLGARVRRFERRPENGWLPDLDELKRQVRPETRLIVLSNLHNPSSGRIPDALLREIASLADTVGASVLVDEVYLDAAFEDTPTTAAHLADNIVVTSSLTKVYGLSGIRCGWIIGNPEVVRRAWRLNNLFGVIPAHAAERLTLAVLANFGPIRDRAQRLLTINRKLLNAFLQSRKDLQHTPHLHGTVAFPRLRRSSVEALCDHLRKYQETTVVPGRFFELPNHFRIGIGCPTEILSEGLNRLGQGLDAIAATDGAG
ncbi:MAG: aminotransferase class I/II-fold pyridoxal phosphate-dependent enzyme [Pedosphaera sp.]|nr:aminotransferase class I/II-fold pyridoxal phosphate-dependent enzyme [Pedosphaera sp.]